jgi:hypothetical protein
VTARDEREEQFGGLALERIAELVAMRKWYRVTRRGSV